MRTIETNPVQLELGQVVTENRALRTYYIPSDQFVLVPRINGLGYSNVKLFHDAEGEKLKDIKISKLAAFKLSDNVVVGKNIHGNWEHWTITAGSVIGVYSKQIKRRTVKPTDRFTIRQALAS